MLDDYFDERVAATYDDGADEPFDAAVVDATVDVLVDPVGNGRALELGIGTGRIAIPLAARGVRDLPRVPGRVRGPGPQRRPMTRPSPA